MSSLSIGDLPWFPAWGVTFEEPVEDPGEVIESWMRERRDERWLLLAGSAAASERHLWTIWLTLAGRVRAGTTIARSVDAEFLRILSGTHQIRIAFERAGIQSGDVTAWIIHLPDPSRADTENNTDAAADAMNEAGRSTSSRFEANDHHLPAYDFHADALEADRLMTWIGADLLPERPIPTLAGLQRIGAIEEEEILTNQRGEGDASLLNLEERFISHAVTCDLN